MCEGGIRALGGTAKKVSFISSQAARFEIGSDCEVLVRLSSKAAIIFIPFNSVQPSSNTNPACY